MSLSFPDLPGGTAAFLVKKEEAIFIPLREKFGILTMTTILF
jgi:hypothetical protein